MTSEDFELPKNPKFYPNNGTYADLLHWHLYIWGTRPDGTQRIWNVRDFHKAVFANNADAPTAARSLNNWLGGGSPPNDTSADLIMKALFQDKRAFEDWRIDLRVARKYSSDSGDNKNTLAERYAALKTKQEVGVRDTDLQLPFAHHQWHKLKAEPTNLNQLLRTDLRATTLVGRDAELNMLGEWLEKSQGVSVKCVVGRAGSGKTRLAIEACEAADRAGWFATFVSSGALQDAGTVREMTQWTLSRLTLLVIDYAASSVTALRSWFDELAQNAKPDGSKLRILLLERHADNQFGWWADLSRPDSHTHASAADLIGGEFPMILPPLDAMHDRRALLTEAMAKAAPLFDPPRSLIAPPNPGVDTWFDSRMADNKVDNEPLFLMMAGICAVESGISTALAMNRLDLAQRIAASEEKRLRDFATASGFKDDGKLLKHIAACVTLQNGCELRELPSLVKVERDGLGLVAPFDDEKICEILCNYLPVIAKVEPVRPDLIGELFCLPIIYGGRFGSDVARRQIVLRCWTRDRVGTSDTLIRCACDIAEGAPDHVSVTYLRDILKEDSNLETLKEISERVPSDTLSLRELSADISSNIVDILRCSPSSDDAVSKSDLAMALNTFARRLSDLGRREEALATVEEALVLYRQLADTRRGALTPDAATALSNFAARLGDLGRHEEALAAVEEALALYRQFAVEQANVFAPDIAMGLSNLAIRLSYLGRLEEGLSAAKEAVSVYRELATAQPDAFVPKLAMAFINLANHLGYLGRREEAHAVTEEGLMLYRQLAAARPDAFTSQTAMSLVNISVRLGDLGRSDEALSAAQEGVILYRKLAAARPDAFMPNLAMAISTLANRLSDLRRGEEALAAAEEALAFYRQLAIIHRDAFTADVAMALSTLTNRLSDLGHGADALSAAEEALSLYRKLAATRPNSFTSHLAMALHNFACRLEDLDRGGDALAAAEEALGLYRQLAATRPEAFAPNLARSLSVMGDILEINDRLSEAVAYDHAALVTLVPHLIKAPDAFEAEIQTYMNDYIRRATVAMMEVDQHLLDDIERHLSIINII